MAGGGALPNGQVESGQKRAMLPGSRVIRMAMLAAASEGREGLLADRCPHDVCILSPQPAALGQQVRLFEEIKLQDSVASS